METSPLVVVGTSRSRVGFGCSEAQAPHLVWSRSRRSSGVSPLQAVSSITAAIRRKNFSSCGPPFFFVSHKLMGKKRRTGDPPFSTRHWLCYNDFVCPNCFYFFSKDHQYLPLPNLINWRMFLSTSELCFSVREWFLISSPALTDRLCLC